MTHPLRKIWPTSEEQSSSSLAFIISLSKPVGLRWLLSIQRQRRSRLNISSRDLSSMVSPPWFLFFGLERSVLPPSILAIIPVLNFLSSFSLCLVPFWPQTS